MRYQLAISTIYIYNYHALNIMACLIMLGLQQIVGEPYFESFPYIELFIKYSLITMIILNSIFLIKSFLTKTYTSINESRQDVFQIISYILMLTFKVGILVLTGFLWGISSGQSYLNTTVHVIIGVFLALYCVSHLSFLFFGTLGLKNRIKHIRIKNHWVFSFLDEHQIMKVKTYQEEGKVIGIYFKNFHMNEKEDELTFRGTDIKLSSFRLYIEGKQCKIDELTREDVSIMEMLSI